MEGERGERTWTRTSLSPENDYRCSNPCRPNGRTAGAPGRVDVTSGIDGIMRRFPTDTTDLRRTRMAGDTDGQCPLCTDLTWSDGAGHEMEGTAQEEVIRLLYRVGGGGRGSTPEKNRTAFFHGTRVLVAGPIDWAVSESISSSTSSLCDPFAVRPMKGAHNTMTQFFLLTNFPSEEATLSLSDRMWMCCDTATYTKAGAVTKSVI